MDNMKDKNELYIQFFGRFQITDGQVTLDADGIRSEMIIKLLSYLIWNRKKVLTVQELSEILWPGDESDNPAGALKNLMYRLRNLMKKTWGDREYVLTGRGSYQWNTQIPVIVDAELFNKYNKLGDGSSDTQDKLKHYMEAVKIYKGEFLPEVNGEYWVISLSAYYFSLYLTMIKRFCVILEEEKQFDVMEEVCQKAIDFEVLDEEIHCLLIRAYFLDNKHVLAMEHYQKAVKLLYDNLGVRPSKGLLDLYEEMLKQHHEFEDDINVIQHQLSETEAHNGAFMCEYGVFRKLYALEVRSSERLSISVHLSLIWLAPTYNLEKGSEAYLKLMGRGMDLLQKVLIESLRSGDIVCRYSGSQYLVLLPACQYEAAVMVMERIQRNFYKSDGKINVRIQCSLDELMLE